MGVGLRQIGAYCIFAHLIYAAAVSYVILTEPTLHSIIIQLTFRKLHFFLLCNALASIVILVISALLRVTLGHIRDLETQALIEAAKTILLDTALFLLMATPTINGQDAPHGILLSCVLGLIATKIVHLIAVGRTASLIEEGTDIRRNNLKRLTGLVFLLISLDSLAIRIFWALSSLSSTFFIWMLFESCGLISSGGACLCKLGIVFVDSSLEHLEEDRASIGRTAQVDLHTDESDDKAVSATSVQGGGEEPAIVNDEENVICGGWPLKSEHLFIVDVAKDLADLGIFMVFLLAFFWANPARLPIYIANDLAQVFRSLTSRMSSFRRYRVFTEKLNTDVPDATLQELIEADTCIICRDLLTIGSKKLSCGHILHLSCIRSWLILHMTCPTCRQEIKIPESVSTPKSSGSDLVLRRMHEDFDDPPKHIGEHIVQGSVSILEGCGAFDREDNINDDESSQDSEDELLAKLASITGMLSQEVDDLNLSI